MGLLGRLSSSEFMPHGYCYLWDPAIVWLHVVSDSLIATSYYCIPLGLLYFVRRRRDVPFHWVFWLFGLFILGCGTTHLMEVWNVWHAAYALAGIIKAITAGVSLVTAASLIPLVPRAVALPSPAQLRAVNRELEQQVAEREQARKDLAEEKSAVRAVRQAEETTKESLAASQRAFKELADQKFALDQHAIVAITDVQGRITYVNDKFCGISKYSREELLGRTHRIINSGHHSREFFRKMYRTIGRGQVWHAEICNRAKDGSIYWVDTTIVPFLNQENKPFQYVVIRSDITERKQQEEILARQAEELSAQTAELVRSQREIRSLYEDLERRVVQRTADLEAANKELEAFTYSVSHDLRAPLRHITGFSGILLEDFAAQLDPPAQEYLRRIQEGTRRMGQLVDELLTLARVGRQALVVQVTGLDSVVREVISILAPEYEGREVEWKIGDLPFVECDRTLIQQVFQNLISNALKYSRPRDHAVIEIGQVEFDNQRAIFVRDNGVGFNMKYSDKLFGVFQRLHRSEDFEGTGVGLATVARIVQKHGGRVWADAQLDCGATFYFTLETPGALEVPLHAAAAEA